MGLFASMRQRKKGATTANMNCYVAKSAENNKTLVLDYEGEKGSAYPLLLYARRHISQFKMDNRKGAATAASRDRLLSQTSLYSQ